MLPNKFAKVALLDECLVFILQLEALFDIMTVVMMEATVPLLVLSNWRSFYWQRLVEVSLTLYVHANLNSRGGQWGIIVETLRTLG